MIRQCETSEQPAPFRGGRQPPPTRGRDMSERWPWRSMKNAPKDGRWIILGWMVNEHILEHEVRSRWAQGKWEGNWTPTHWRPA